MATAHDARPGFRRRFRITPETGCVTAAVEDDFHCMVVTLHHSAGVIAGVESAMERWPWTTCPGATTVLASTFTGAPLAEVAKRGLKSSNCTHLYDLTIFAAAHAGDAEATHYDVLVGDAVTLRKHAEIRKNGELILEWMIEDDILRAPEVVDGIGVMQLRDWIATQVPETREAARILQWAVLIAHGRSIPLVRQSDATKMPPNCYTFQPDRAQQATRIGKILDFSGTARRPLEHFDGRRFVS